MPDTDADQRRRLWQGPAVGEQPGGLGRMGVRVTCAPGQAEAVLSTIRSRLDGHLRGDTPADGVDLDADWGVWSLSVASPTQLRLELVVFGFPISGFSGLRRFLIASGARQVTQLPQG